jgi:hypothetical protein
VARNPGEHEQVRVDETQAVGLPRLAESIRFERTFPGLDVGADAIRDALRRVPG